MRDIGKNIRTLRTKLNMTQDELAEKLFVTRQTVSNYETGRSRPDVEMLARIAEVLGTDANTVIYGPAPEPNKTTSALLIAVYVVTVLLVLFREIVTPYARKYSAYTFSLAPTVLIYGILDPVIWLFVGWTLTQMITTALKKGPLPHRCIPILRRVLALVLVLWLLLSVPYIILFALDDYLYAAKLRGEMVDEPYESNGEIVIGQSWQRIPLPGLDLLKKPGIPVMQFNIRYPWAAGILGAALCICGFPINWITHKKREGQ